VLEDFIELVKFHFLILQIEYDFKMFFEETVDEFYKTLVLFGCL